MSIWANKRMGQGVELTLDGASRCGSREDQGHKYQPVLDADGIVGHEASSGVEP